MSVSFANNYLESLPLNNIVRHSGGPPKNGVPFIGCPQQHRTEKHKLILVYDPLGKNPAVLEFKLDDVLYVEDFPQAVTESGEGIPMVKLWLRKGARGILFEPFEVDEAAKFLKTREEQNNRFMKQHADSKSDTFSKARSVRS